MKKNINTRYAIVIRNLDTFVLEEIKIDAKDLKTYTENPRVWVYAVREI